MGSPQGRLPADGLPASGEGRRPIGAPPQSVSGSGGASIESDIFCTSAVSAATAVIRGATASATAPATAAGRRGTVSTAFPDGERRVTVRRERAAVAVIVAGG